MARPKLDNKRQIETAYVTPRVADAVSQFQSAGRYRSRSAAVEALLEFALKKQNYLKEK